MPLHRPLLLVFTALVVIAGVAATCASPDAPRGANNAPALAAIPARRAPLSYRSDVQPILEHRCVVCHGCYDAPCQLLLSSPARHRARRQQGGRLRHRAPEATRADAALHRRADTAAVAPARLLPGDGDAAPARRRRCCADARARARAPVRPGREAARRRSALDIDRTLSCAQRGRVRRLRRAASARRHALRHGAAQPTPSSACWRPGSRRARRRRRPPPLPAAATAQVAALGERSSTATRSSSASPRATSTSTGSSPTSTSTTCPTGPFFRVVRSRRRPARRSTRSPRGAPTTSPGVDALLVPPAADRRDHRAQDAHRLPAQPGAHAAPAGALPRRRLAADAAAGYARRRGVESLRHLRPDPGARALPVHARRRAVLRHDLHPRPGVPRPGGGRRHRGPLLRRLPRPRSRPLGHRPELPRSRRKRPAQPARRAPEPPRAGRVLAPVRPRAAPLPRPARAVLRRAGSRSAAARRSTSSGTATAATRNAQLTVFRHFDNATVVRGFLGAMPKTAWVIDYPLFERIYYDLVAGYDVFGSVDAPGRDAPLHGSPAHAGGEPLPTFLPADQREAIRASWYVGATRSLDYDLPTACTARPRHAASVPRRRREGPAAGPDAVAIRRVAGPPDLLNRCAPPPCDRPGATPREARRARRCSRSPACAAPWVAACRRSRSSACAPTRAGRDRVYSLVHDRAHTNVAFMFDEDGTADPGRRHAHRRARPFGSYPNFVFEVERRRVRRSSPSWVPSRATRTSSASSRATACAARIRASGRRRTGCARPRVARTRRKRASMTSIVTTTSEIAQTSAAPRASSRNARPQSSCVVAIATSAASSESASARRPSSRSQSNTARAGFPLS